MCQEVLAEAGYDVHLVTLAAEDPADGIAAELAVRPEVKLIDFTGSNAFGKWLEDNARQAEVFSEKAGVNAVVIDSTDSFQGMCFNVAFSLALYSGQMCTAPQNHLCAGMPASRRTRVTSLLDEVAAGLSASLAKLVGVDAKAVELLGGVVNEGVLDRLAVAVSRCAWGRGGGVPGGQPPGVRRGGGADASRGGTRR
ncbi:MAG: aldehyde dehydrogenase family protein [Nocardioidaceae bacterium]